MKGLIVNYLILITMNLAMVYSATYKQLLGAGKLPISEILSNIVFLLLFFTFSIIVLRVGSPMKKLIDKNVKLFYIVVIIMLFLVLTPIGVVLGGARSSLPIGPINFQPIEVAKIMMIFYLAKVLSETTSLKDKEQLKKVLILPILTIFLVLIEVDTGGALILSALFVTMLILNGKDLISIFKWVGIIGVVGIISLLLLVNVSSSAGDSYQSSRIGAWLDPFEYYVEGGENLIQSYIAISNGGLVGEGYLNSTQNTGYLYASSSDFIYAIIAEEFGLFGIIFVLVAISVLAIQIFFIGYNSRRKYEYLVCSGISALILIQTMVNVGGVTGVIPMTGVTLPFISKGINSLMFLSLGVLYVLLVRQQNIKEKRNERKEKGSLRTHSVL